MIVVNDSKNKQFVVVAKATGNNRVLNVSETIRTKGSVKKNIDALLKVCEEALRLKAAGQPYYRDNTKSKKK